MFRTTSRKHRQTASTLREGKKLSLCWFLGEAYPSFPGHGPRKEGGREEGLFAYHFLAVLLHGKPTSSPAIFGHYALAQGRWWRGTTYTGSSLALPTRYLLVVGYPTEPHSRWTLAMLCAAASSAALSARGLLEAHRATPHFHEHSRCTLSNAKFSASHQGRYNCNFSSCIIISNKHSQNLKTLPSCLWNETTLLELHHLN